MICNSLPTTPKALKTSRILPGWYSVSYLQPQIVTVDIIRDQPGMPWQVVVKVEDKEREIIASESSLTAAKGAAFTFLTKEA